MGVVARYCPASRKPLSMRNFQVKKRLLSDTSILEGGGEGIGGEINTPDWRRGIGLEIKQGTIEPKQ
jgi:hypothetical protein